MSKIKCWQVDAFTDRPFCGNPAAVCWLEQPVSDDWMQSVAAEMNLSETAFVQRRDDGYSLRWFTPTVEVDLCGHATLATSHLLWESGIADHASPLQFHTRSGLLTCVRNGELIELDFPALPAEPTPSDPELFDALGIDTAQFIGVTKFDKLVVVDSAEQVYALKPDFQKLGQIPVRGVIVTARSAAPQYDFVSRFFAPYVGVNEDPVCGSAHCCLTHFWANRLGKSELVAYQASARSGVLHLRWNGDRVVLGGQAVTVWQGELLATPTPV